MWEPTTGQSFRTLKGHNDAVMGIDTCWYILFRETYQVVITWVALILLTRTVAHSSNGRMMIAAASMDKTVRIWNAVLAAKTKKDESGLGRGSYMDCKFGCGLQLPQERMKLHEESCPQRMTQCPACQKDLVSRDLDSHSSECSEMASVCVCGAQVRNRDRRRHQRDECPQREIECTLGCGMLLKISSLEAHTKTFCQERMVKCKLGCGASVPARGLMSHQQSGCQNRNVTCQLCQATFSANEADQHKRRYCPVREVQCRLGCGEKFAARNTEVHEKEACGMRLVNCSKGCGQTCAAKDLATHERKCNGPVPGDFPQFCLSRPMSSVRHPSPLITQLAEWTTPMSGVASPGSPSGFASPGSPMLLPEIESPGRRSQGMIGCESPGRISKSKCNACGHSERYCTSCFTFFCSRCLVRSGLPKTIPPLCGACSRENNMRVRELVARAGPAPMRFG